MCAVQNPHIHGAGSSSLVDTDHVGETIIETGSPIFMLELADVNKYIRPFGQWRDKAESPVVVPQHNFIAMTLTPQPQPHRRPCKMNPSASPRP